MAYNVELTADFHLCKADHLVRFLFPLANRGEDLTWLFQDECVLNSDIYTGMMLF